VLLPSLVTIAGIRGSASSESLEDMCPHFGFLEQWVCSKNDQNGFLGNQSVGAYPINLSTFQTTQKPSEKY
jgi:hypothetical protein